MKELESSIEQYKKKIKGLEGQLGPALENKKSFEMSKRVFEQKNAEKHTEIEKLMREKEQLLGNLKGMERNLEEKNLNIKKNERNGLELQEETKFLKEKLELVLKEKEGILKENQAFSLEIKEFERKTKDFIREKERFEEVFKKNADLEQNFTQSLNIFKQNTELLRSENLSLSEKLKEKLEELAFVQKESFENQKKNSQISVILSENENFKIKETRFQEKIAVLEQENQKKSEENGILSKNLQNSEENSIESNRKIARIRINYKKILVKIQKNFERLKDEKYALNSRIHQILNDNYKEIMRVLSLFPNYLSRFLTICNENQLNEKLETEEKLMKKYEEIMINLKRKYEENEGNSSANFDVQKKEFLEKMKELQMEINENQMKFQQENSEKRFLEKEKVVLTEKVEVLLAKEPNFEEFKEVFKGFFGEMKGKFENYVDLLKENQKKKTKNLKKKLIELQKELKNSFENQTEKLKKFKGEFLDILLRILTENEEKNRFYEEKIQENGFLKEKLKFFFEENEEIKENLMKNEEKKVYLCEMYEKTIREIEAKFLKSEISFVNLQKENEFLKKATQDLEKSIIQKNEEIRVLKYEKSRIYEKKDEIKGQILKEKESNYAEMMNLQRIIKKNKRNDEVFIGNKVEIMENRIRELQQINRNIFEHKKMETEKSERHSPQKFPRNERNYHSSLSIDLKD